MSYEPLGYGDRLYDWVFRPPTNANWPLLPIAILCVALIACVYGAVVDFEIAKRQRSTIAIVIAHHPEDHDSYDLRINLDGSLYTARMNNLIRGFTLNERVLVFFDPKDPEIMSVKNFSDDGKDLIVTILFILFGIMVLLIILSKGKSVANRGDVGISERAASFGFICKTGLPAS